MYPMHPHEHPHEQTPPWEKGNFIIYDCVAIWFLHGEGYVCDLDELEQFLEEEFGGEWVW